MPRPKEPDRVRMQLHVRRATRKAIIAAVDEKDKTRNTRSKVVDRAFEPK